MLSRIKKNIIMAVLAGTMCLALPCYGIDSTVSYVSINNLAYQDIEIVITDNNEILVPFKQLADIFEIKYEANRVDKKISFVTFDGKQGMITQQGVFIEDMPVSKRAPIFLTQGIMDGVFNEAYITASSISQVMGIELETDFENLTLEAKVSRNIKVLANANNEINADDKGPHAFQDVAAPKKKGKITLNTIGLRSNMLSDNMSVKYDGVKNINDTFAGSTQASINGDILGGRYRVEATEYHYRNDAFMFGGITGTYMNSIKDKNTKKDKYFYELGRVTGSSDMDSQIGTNIFGGQLWNYNYRKERPEEINGYVKPTSLVRLTVNGLEPVTLSTYAGYYTLKDVKLPNPVLSVKLEEVNEDGSVELIREEKYSLYDNETPFEGEHHATAYAGIWGYQDRFFREGQNIYRGNNKKGTFGADYKYGIRDNVTFDSKLTGDKIYEKNGSRVYFRVPTNDTLLVSGTQKSVNYLEGLSSLNSVEWKSEKNKNIKARATGGVSLANDIRENITRGGYTGRLAAEYENNDLNKYSNGIFKPKRLFGKLELFHNSQDWYMASTDSTSKNDRTGGKVSAGASFNSTSASGSYSKYYSNTSHRYEGGTIKFDEASINASTKIPKVANLRFSSFYRRGSNELGRNRNYNYDAGGFRDFGKWARLQAGRREYVYDTRYDNPTDFNRNYYSKYDDNYIQLDVPIPHNFGKFTLGHDMIHYKTTTYKNGYNMFRFGYVFPTWKRLTLGLGWGFRYHGQGGNDLNVNLSYRSKTGQSATIGYQYSENGGYFIDNMFMPTTNRHSINFVFNDAFQIFHNGLKSVGDEDLNKGLFEAIAFVDVNKNGKFDKNIDVPVSDVPLITSWTGQTNVTNKKGRVYSESLEQGIYTVTIDMNSLPITVAPSTNDIITRKVKIDGGQTTKLELPLISTVGSVSGVLKISDDFDRKLKLTDFVVVLLDQNGDEVNYSTLDESGQFYISGLAPGRYKLQLDDKFIGAYGLEELPNSSIDVIIPYDYKNPTDIMDLNLEYKTISL